MGLSAKLSHTYSIVQGPSLISLNTITNLQIYNAHTCNQPPCHSACDDSTCWHPNNSMSLIISLYNILATPLPKFGPQKPCRVYLEKAIKQNKCLGGNAICNSPLSVITSRNWMWKVKNCFCKDSCTLQMYISSGLDLDLSKGENDVTLILTS